MAIEPPEEFKRILKLQPNEILKLEKGAYGLIDAPYQWFCALLQALLELNFAQSSFDPCLFILVNPQSGSPEGVLRMHVDDGIGGGSLRFLNTIAELERRLFLGQGKVGHSPSRG